MRDKMGRETLIDSEINLTVLRTKKQGASQVKICCLISLDNHMKKDSLDPLIKFLMDCKI